MRLLTLHDLTNVTSLYSLQMRYLLSTQQQFSRGLEGMIDAASDHALKTRSARTCKKSRFSLSASIRF